MNMLIGSKMCWNQHGTPINLFFSWNRSILSWKKSALVWYEILRLFVNTFTADEKYSRSNNQNLQQQFQTPLSQNQKTFPKFLIAFLKRAWNLEHFPKKDEYPSLLISEILNPEKRDYLNV